jgi:hypothetical protein
MLCTLEEWQSRFKEPKDLIVQASTIDEPDRWQPFPIGMSFQYMWNYNRGPSIQIGSHDKTVLCCIREATDSGRRPTDKNRRGILHTLGQNNIKNESIHSTTYFSQLPEYKFVISPEGNGIDCHRHYEALLAGCIPIVEHNPLIEEKYKGCPVLYTHDYSEITEDYLGKVYENMKSQTYDFSRLFVSFYTQEQIALLKHCGNYWTQRCTHMKFYKE